MPGELFLEQFPRANRQYFGCVFVHPIYKRFDMKCYPSSQPSQADSTFGGNLKSGQVRYFVSSMGLLGQEQVLSVAREEYFADGKLPTVDSVLRMRSELRRASARGMLLSE